MSQVSIKNLDIAFGSHKVIRNLDLHIQPGEFLVLLGASGCGKSTLLNAVAGLTDVAGGQIWIGDRNVTWAEPKDRGIGMVFQSYALYPRMTVEQNMSFGLEMARLPKPEIRERVARAAEMLQLKPLMQRRPAELSGGQRQRVAIGRALVRDADVYLFDEPLSNLDAKLRTELRVELKKLHARLGTTMIYVTHDQVEALTLANRIAVMQGGVIQQLDAPDEIYRRPVNKFVAGFVGSPGMNFIEGELLVRDGKIDLKTAKGTLDLTRYPFMEPPQNGHKVTLGLRPEHLQPEPEEGYCPATMTISVHESMGADALLWAELSGATVSVKLPSDWSPVPVSGERVTMWYDAARLSVFDAKTEERL
ncbi:ABC transporter ATP-binding protein [Thioclava sp. GXIMD2076]|uniref:ABC transporter ATP-binding protein n=1 Tax=Thioclava kandeliae TaxID=3070818 RepID=A0ABV1SLG5_9RHOB